LIEKISFFNKYGYVIFENVLTEDEIKKSIIGLYHEVNDYYQMIHQIGSTK
jgi:hypothetical protein